MGRYSDYGFGLGPAFTPEGIGFARLMVRQWGVVTQYRSATVADSHGVSCGHDSYSFL
jgi:hypothetical protein